MYTRVYRFRRPGPRQDTGENPAGFLYNGSLADNMK